MGRPKQVLPFGEGTLLQHVIHIASQVNFDEIRVVLGAHRQLILPVLKEMSVQLSFNSDWEKGMASSIAQGISDLPKNSEGALIMLGDQPFVSSAHLEALVQKHLESQKPIVASFYKGKMGVPALFHHSFYEKLKDLKGKQGAGKLIGTNPQELEFIEFPEAAIDLDTPEDYEKWKRRID